MIENISNTQYRDYIKYINFAAERVFHKYQEYQKEVYQVTKSKLVLPNDEIDELQIALEERNHIIAEKKRELEERNHIIAEQDSKLAEQNSKLAKQDSELAEQNSKLVEQGSRLARYERYFKSNGINPDSII